MRGSPSGSAAGASGDELGDREPDDIDGLPMSPAMRRACALVNPFGSAPRPSTISLLGIPA
jgi:hypothetical protein